MAKYEYGRIRSTRFVAMILVAFCYLLLWSAYSSADEASDKEHARRIQEEIKRNAANLLHITGKVKGSLISQKMSAHRNLLQSLLRST